MKFIFGIALAMFVGLILTYALLEMQRLKTDTNIPLVLAVIGGSMMGIWAVTNANGLLIQLKASWDVTFGKKTGRDDDD